jgi:hypothetical protein
MKKIVLILSIFLLLNSCSKGLPSYYYIEQSALCYSRIDIRTYNTTTRVGYVQFGYDNSFTPAANKWYKTNGRAITSSGEWVPIYIKIGSNNSPAPLSSANKEYSFVVDFTEYDSPCD